MGVMSEMEGLLQDFLTEAGELLEDVDQKLIDLEASPNDNGLLNTIFRGFHTIKGGAGFLEAPAMVTLCHRTENLFDQLRAGKLVLNPAMLDVILQATAEVKRMMGEMAAGRDIAPAEDSLLAQIEAIARGEALQPPAAAALLPAGAAAQVDWVQLHRAVCPPGAYAMADAAGKSGAGVVPATPAPLAVSIATASAPPSPVAAPAQATKPQRTAAQPAPPKENSLRIDASRIDRMLDLSGEIGLAKNRLISLYADWQRGNTASSGGFEQVLGTLDTLVCDLQSVVMKTRLQPVSRVFQKYVRMSRDLARQVGKEVELVLEGADTEVDKTILEELNDPLVHLVRNAVDHGIEAPDQRIACGKPARGTIRLSARQAGDQIVIEIIDDGQGMDIALLRRKAVDKGLITPEAANLLDERQSLELIFLPGFSTKEQISDLSGRGVGMDVVRTNIARLKGQIALFSTPGQGSRTVISLPLTLAIMPVLMTCLAGQVYAIPLASVREIMLLDLANVQLVGGLQNVSLRGEVLPVIHLADLLGCARSTEPGTGVIVSLAGHSCILAVDSVAGQDEVMIKPLDGLKPRGVAGATLSREGLLVLALDLPELLRASSGAPRSGGFARSV